MQKLASTFLGLICAPFYLFLYLYVRLLAVRKNQQTKASDPGLIPLSHARLERLCPEFFATGINPVTRFDQMVGARAIQIFRVADQLIHGDSRAAVVMSISPLLVAAYTDELDCIAMLRFRDEFVQVYDLQVRSRLLAVNAYVRDRGLARDLEIGTLAYNRFTNFRPLIADFLSDDTDRIRQRKLSIDKDEWVRTWVLGERYLASFGNQARDGTPPLCMKAAAVAPAANRAEPGTP